MRRRAAMLTFICAVALAAPAWAGPLAPVVGVVVQPSAFSPNGDGAKDTTAISVSLDAPASLDVVVQDATLATVRVLASATAAPAGPSTFTWDGLDDAAARVPDGAYTVVATADDGAGGITTVSAPVRVDTKAPRFRWRGIRPEPVVTNKAVHFSFRSSDAAPSLSASLAVNDHSGEVGSVDDVPRAPGADSVTWIPRYANGNPILQGLYQARITLSDDAGNRTRSSWRPFRDLRPDNTRVIHRLEGTGPRVALTFDDCNDGAAWSKILHILRDRHAQATFFCLGGNVGRFKAQARRTVADGNTIGDHSFNHALQTGLSFTNILAQARKDQAVWWKVAHVTPAPFFRPPYGAYDASSLHAVGAAGYPRTIIWDVDPQDWARPGAGVIADRVLAHARAGSIVVMHTLPQTAAALPSIISRLRARGLEPVGLSELFSQAGMRVPAYEPTAPVYE